MKQASVMRTASALLALLLPPVCRSTSKVPSRGRLPNVDQVMSNIMEEVEDVTKNHPPRRRLIINECLDATEYFNWEYFSAGENLLRLYYDCSCSGDFGFDFSMQCVMENYCYTSDDVTSIAQNASLRLPEKCVSRTYTYDFVVDTDTKEIRDLARLVASDVFESGFGFNGTLTNVNSNPCGLKLEREYDFEIEEALSICTNRTTCEAFFNDNTTLSPDEIDYICPIVMFDGVECNGVNLDPCADVDNDSETRLVAIPDCSNVNPCLTSSCQAYPQVDNTPERFLFRYPECDAGTENPTNDDTKTPTFAPTMTVSDVPTTVDICSNAVKYVGISEILKENYDCDCSSSSEDMNPLVLECRMEDYCFLDKNTASLEYCVNHNLTFTYTLDSDTNEILDLTRAEACTDFLQNGPEGRLCRNDWSICFLTLYDALLERENATATCLVDRNFCIEATKSILNYTQAEAEYLCPLVTLNGKECNSIGFDECGEQDFDNNLVFRSMPDCSNVESCAESTCQTAQVRDPTPQRFMETYPQCGLPNSGGNNGGDYEPTETPTASSAGDLSPGDTIRASGERGRFDYSAFGSILLCTVTVFLVSQS